MYGADPHTVRAAFTGVANPFALRWIPADVKLTRDNAPLSNDPSDLIGSIDPLPYSQWWNFQIFPDGEFLFAPGNDPAMPFSAAISGGSNQSSLLKIEIEVALGNNQSRTLRMDLGSGIDIALHCKKISHVRVLIPDPASIPATLPPVYMTDPRFFWTAVTASVNCSQAPRSVTRPTYSQLFYTLGMQSFFMPRVAASKEIEVFADRPFGTDLFHFVYALQSPLPAGYVIPPNAPVGDLSLPALLRNTVRAIIPGQANGFNYEMLESPDNTTVNVVQILHF